MMVFVNHVIMLLGNSSLWRKGLVVGSLSENWRAQSCALGSSLKASQLDREIHIFFAG